MSGCVHAGKRLWPDRFCRRMAQEMRIETRTTYLCIELHWSVTATNVWRRQFPVASFNSWNVYGRRTVQQTMVQHGVRFLETPQWTILTVCVKMWHGITVVLLVPIRVRFTQTHPQINGCVYNVHDLKRNKNENILKPYELCHPHKVNESILNVAFYSKLRTIRDDEFGYEWPTSRMRDR
jgi:hypothetical protein